MLRKITIRLLAVVSLLLIVLVVLLLQPPFQTWVVNHTLQAVLEPQPFAIHLDRISVRPSGLIQISGLQAYDTSGQEILHLGHTAASLNWISLLRKQVSIAFLTVTDIRLAPSDTLIQDMQEYNASQPPSQESGWSIQLRNLRLNDINITEDSSLFPDFLTTDIVGKGRLQSLVANGEGLTVQNAELQLGPLHLQGSGHLDATGLLEGDIAELAVLGILPHDLHASGPFHVSPQELSLDWSMNYHNHSGNVHAAVYTTDKGETYDQLHYSLIIQLENQTLTAEIEGLVTPTENNVAGSLQIDQLSPRKLGLPVDEVQLTGSSDYRLDWSDGVDFSVTLHELLLDSGGERQHITNTIIDGKVSESGMVIDVAGPGIAAHAAANSALLGYSQKALADPLSALENLPQNATGELSVTVDAPSRLLPPLLPGLIHLAPLSAEFSLQQGQLYGSVSLTELVLTDSSLHDISVNLTGNSNTVEYNASANSLQIRDFPVVQPRISGYLNRDQLKIAVQILTENSFEALNVSAIMYYESQSTVLFLEPAELHIWGQTWQLPEQHRVTFHPDEIDMYGIELRHNEMLIAVDEVGTSGANLRIQGFDIAQLPELEGFAGILSADAQLHFGERISANFNVRADALEIHHRPIGKLRLTGQWDDQLEAKLELENDNSHASARLWFDPTIRKIDLDIDIANIDIDYISDLLPDEIEHPVGSITGGLQVSGTLEDPAIEGNLQLLGAGFRLSRLGTTYTIDSQLISIRDTAVHLNNFQLRDARGRTATLQGSIHLAINPSELLFDISVRSQGIKILDTLASSGAALYGKLFLESNLRIEGSLTTPHISGSIGVTRDSDLTAQLPQTGSETGIGQDIVRFRSSVEILPEIDTPPLLTGIEVSTLLQIHPEAQLTLLIDPMRGDRLHVRGGGDLSLEIDTGGEVSLSGRYSIQQGSYRLQFLTFGQRELTLRREGSINWSGDPADAELDLVAVHQVRTSPAPILSNRDEPSVAGDLPFEVLVNITGSFQQPNIGFLLDMPAVEREALGGRPYAALQNINQFETRRNTQAFALIVLNQFIHDDIFGIDETAVLGTGARSSISELLTYQLNALTARYIPGVNLSFSVDSFLEATEDGPAGRTELQVEVAQQLFNDRVTVRFGGQYDIERDPREQLNWSELAGDVSVEYSLTRDGRYRLRAFHERGTRRPGIDSPDTTGASLLFSRQRDPYAEEDK